MYNDQETSSEDVKLAEKIEDTIDINEALAAKKEMQTTGGIKWEIFKQELDDLF